MTAPRKGNKIRLMASGFRHVYLPAITALGLMAASALIATLVWQEWRTFPKSLRPSSSHSLSNSTAGVFVAPAVETVTGEVWSVLRVTGSLGGAGGIAGDGRFRLAGTFSMEDNNGVIQRRAVLDDLTQKQQYVVSVGSIIGEDGRVDEIRSDMVLLHIANRSVEVRMEFRGLPLAAEGPLADTNSVKALVGISTNRFGVMVADNRWVMLRKPLMDYYQELLDQPRRLQQVYDSLKPVYNESKRITGYTVGIEGEKDFFDAIGLQAGDVVKKANSMNMNNRRRADYLIREFSNDKLSAIVLEIQRNGQPAKLIYEVRPDADASPAPSAASAATPVPPASTATP